MLENNIHPIGYCPVAREANIAKKGYSNVCEHEVIKKCAEKYGKTGAQILLNWGMQRGHIVIPKSSNMGRLKENIESCDFGMS
jgi:diketogulonate reductase-like aldo/keto reductase